MAPPIKPVNYVLVHEGRHGMAMHRFSTIRELPKALIVYEDLTDEMRALLRFLLVTVEYDDYIIIRRESEHMGVWA